MKKNDLLVGCLYTNSKSIRVNAYRNIDIKKSLRGDFWDHGLAYNQQDKSDLPVNYSYETTRTFVFENLGCASNGTYNKIVEILKDNKHFKVGDIIFITNHDAVILADDSGFNPRQVRTLNLDKRFKNKSKELKALEKKVAELTKEVGKMDLELVKLKAYPSDEAEHADMIYKMLISKHNCVTPQDIEQLLKE